MSPTANEGLVGRRVHIITTTTNEAINQTLTGRSGTILAVNNAGWTIKLDAIKSQTCPHLSRDNQTVVVTHAVPAVFVLEN